MPQSAGYFNRYPQKSDKNFFKMSTERYVGGFLGWRYKEKQHGNAVLLS